MWDSERIKVSCLFFQILKLESFVHEVFFFFFFFKGSKSCISWKKKKKKKREGKKKNDNWKRFRSSWPTFPLIFILNITNLFSQFCIFILMLIYVIIVCVFLKYVDNIRSFLLDEWLLSLCHDSYRSMALSFPHLGDVWFN